MAKEPQKTFEQNMEAMSKMTPAQMQAKIKELEWKNGSKYYG